MKVLLNFFFIFLFCFSLLYGEEKPLILVSISTYQPLVQDLAGDQFCVESLVPENVNFHSYEPTMRTALKYSRASLWCAIGESFEKHLEQFFNSQEKGPKIVLLNSQTRCVESGFHDHESEEDPHTWTNPRMIKEQMRTILEALKELFPDQIKIFEKNYSEFEGRCDELIVIMDNLLSHLQNRPLFVAHAAFGSLCKCYDIRQVALESGGKEMTPVYLHRVLKEGTEHHVTTVFSLKGFSKKGVESVATVLHAQVEELDPYVPSYFKEMESIAVKIKKALQNEVE